MSSKWCTAYFVADVGFHELQLAISLHKQWLKGSWADEVSGQRLLARYLRAMRHLQHSLSSRLVTYDIHAMAASSVALCIVRNSFCCFLYAVLMLIMCVTADKCL